MALRKNFPLTRANLGGYDGVTVGVLVLHLDDVDNDIDNTTMLYVDDLTAWELPGGGDYTRTTVELAFDTDAGVLRYATEATPPTFDTTGHDPNAVVFYDTTGADDEAHKLLFALGVEEGPGYTDWTADEPDDGLAIVTDAPDTPGPVGSTAPEPLLLHHSFRRCEDGPVTGASNGQGLLGPVDLFDPSSGIPLVMQEAQIADGALRLRDVAPHQAVVVAGDERLAAATTGGGGLMFGGWSGSLTPEDLDGGVMVGVSTSHVGDGYAAAVVTDFDGDSAAESVLHIHTTTAEGAVASIASTPLLRPLAAGDTIELKVVDNGDANTLTATWNGAVTVEIDDATFDAQTFDNAAVTLFSDAAVPGSWLPSVTDVWLTDGGGWWPGSLPGSGTGSGAVDSVNGQTGTVVLDAADVGAATPGDVAAAVAAHTAATDPHGDRAYAAGLFASNDAMLFKGTVDCSANPNYPAADAGHTYRVSVAGRIGGGSGPKVEAGDLLMCTADSTASGNHATVGASWTIGQTNIDGAVIGPAAATDAHVALFDGTTGKLIKDGGATGTAGLTILTKAAPADVRSYLASPWVQIDDVTLGASAASVSFNVTGFARVRARLVSAIVSTGLGQRDVYVQFNGDTGANYGANAGALGSTAAIIATIPGQQTNTDRVGSAEFSYEYMAGKWLAGLRSLALMNSTGTTGGSGSLAAWWWSGAASAAPTSMVLTPVSSSFIAGSRFIVEGII